MSGADPRARRAHGERRANRATRAPRATRATRALRAARAARARRKLGEWLARYGPPEIVGTLGALGGSFLVFHLSGSEVAAAYGGAMGENAGFYGTLLIREILGARPASRVSRVSDGTSGTSGTSAADATDRPATARRAVHTLRGAGRLLIEFGPAELLDSFIVRPLLMGVASHHLGRGWGVLAGKLAADVTFYLPVIASYELHRAIERRGRARGRR